MQIQTQPLVETTEIFGLSIKTKVNGSWATPLPSVKVGGNWVKAKKIHTKVGGVWTGIYEYESVYTFSAGYYTDTDLDVIVTDKYHNVKIIVDNGASLRASSTSTYSLKTGTGYGGTLSFQYVQQQSGRGGDGGAGGGGTRAAQNGQNGGVFAHIECPITFIWTPFGGIPIQGDTANGISGGSGGGGGGEGRTYFMGGGGAGGNGRSGGTGGDGDLVSPASESGFPLPRDGGQGGETRGTRDGGWGGTIGNATGGRGGHNGGYGSGLRGGNGQPATGTDGGSSTGSAGSGGYAGVPLYNPNNFTVTYIQI